MRQHAENLRSTLVPKRAKWCPGRDLNPHFPCEKKDFKSFASADFATRALSLHHNKCRCTRVTVKKNVLPCPVERPDQSAFFNHRTLFGSVFWHLMVSSTPDEISAHAFSVADRTAAFSLFAFTLLQTVCPLNVMQTSTR